MDKKVQEEQKELSPYELLSTAELTIKDDISKYAEYEKLIIDVKSDQNIIALARKQPLHYNKYIELLKHDYMFYMHKGQNSYFIKRNQLETVWLRKDLVRKGDLFYTVEDIPGEKVNHMVPKRLVVIFSSMPSPADYYSPNIGIRCFTKNFPSLPKHLVKGTRIMRIMDTNLSHGSYYMNTENYSNFESDVQDAIKEVLEQYSIDKEDVVLYGGSKAGTGALYHSLLGDYKAVCVDPILNLKEYNLKMSDIHFLKNFLNEDFLEPMLNLTGESKYKKIVIASPTDPFNYKFVKQLTENSNGSIELYNVFDNAIKGHSDISVNTMAEQVTFINNLLLDSKTFKTMNDELYDLTMESFNTL